MPNAPSIFKQSRLETQEQPSETPDIFRESRPHKREQIIPPIGIAAPELVESFQENMEDEDKILSDIADLEAYYKETPVQSGTREVLSHGARAAEGFAGSLFSFLNLMNPDLYQDEEGMPYGPGERPQGLPGTEELHNLTKDLTGKYLEPKGEKSKASQETASDIGAMFSTPGLGAMTKILAPVGGQITKQVIKGSGGGETAQELGKLGFMTMSSIANLGNAPRVAAQAMQQAREMIPQGLRFNAQHTQQALNRIRQSNWYSTGSTPSKAPAMHEIDRIQGHIQNGMIDGRMAMQLRQDINEARRQLGAFTLNPVADRRAARHYLDEVDRALLSSMENYGTRVNPQWWNNYNAANEAFRVTQRSRLISDFIQQYARPLNSEMAKTLFHVGAGAGLIKLPAIAAAAIPAVGTAKGIQLMNRMIHSSVLRNHYIDVLRASATGNAAVMNKALKQFDKSAEKYEYPKDKKEKLNVTFHEDEDLQENN